MGQTTSCFSSESVLMPSSLRVPQSNWCHPWSRHLRSYKALRRWMRGLRPDKCSRSFSITNPTAWPTTWKIHPVMSIAQLEPAPADEAPWERPIPGHPGPVKPEGDPAGHSYEIQRISGNESGKHACRISSQMARMGSRMGRVNSGGGLGPGARASPRIRSGVAR